MKRHSNAVRGKGNAHREKKLQHTNLRVKSFLSFAYIDRKEPPIFVSQMFCMCTSNHCGCFSRPPARRRPFAKASEDLLLFTLIVMPLDDSFGKPQVASKLRKRCDFLFSRKHRGCSYITSRNSER